MKLSLVVLTAGASKGKIIPIKCVAQFLDTVEIAAVSAADHVASH